MVSLRSAALALLVCACDVPDAIPMDAGAVALPRGLERIAQLAHPTDGPHLGEVTIDGDLVYVANSWDGFGVYALEPDATFATLRRPADAPDVRCTTLAIHAASRSLYCGSDESWTVRTYDLTDREAPTFRTETARGDGQLRVADLLVVGDWLYLARFDLGLWAMPIAPDGTLGEPVPTAVVGNVRLLAGGEPLYALTADHGLVRTRGTGADLATDAERIVDGVPLDLVVHGDRAAVALGSAGARVFRLPELEPVADVRPRAVATSVDLAGSVLAVATLTGLYAYDLETSPPRLFGYERAGHVGTLGAGVYLSTRFASDGTLFASDWSFVERFAVDPAGFVLEVDVTRGLYVAPGAGAQLAFRNEGDAMLSVDVARSSTVVVPPGETAYAHLAPDAIAALPAAGGTRTLELETRSEGAVVSRIQLAIELRADVVVATTRPAPGDAFGPLAFAAEDGTVATAPIGARTLHVFYTRDCAAMWPVLTDAAELARRGVLDGGATPLFLAVTDAVADGYAREWDLRGARFGHHGNLAPPEVIAANGSETVYEDRFQLLALPRGAAHPTNYLVDDAGVVVVVETAYRGAHPLR